jgi:inorganic pyrophosphatase
MWAHKGWLKRYQSKGYRNMKIQRPISNKNIWLGKQHDVQIDRPLHSTHPRHPDIKYELNYGFVPDTCAADGHEVDVYVMGVDRPIDRFTGHCIAIIHRKNDTEDKLIIAPMGINFTDAEIMTQTHFQEQYFDVVLIRP